jgi:hypothetical protein
VSKKTGAPLESTARRSKHKEKQKVGNGVFRLLFPDFLFKLL